MRKFGWAMFIGYIISFILIYHSLYSSYIFREYVGWLAPVLFSVGVMVFLGWELSHPESRRIDRVIKIAGLVTLITTVLLIIWSSIK